MRCGVDGCVFQRADGVAGHRVYLAYAVNNIVEEFDAHRKVFTVCGEYLYNVTAHAESVTDKIHIVALVGYRDKMLDKLVPVHHHSGAHGEHKL